MTQDRSVDERISVWLLEEAPDQLPDRVLQATFARTSLSRQRRQLLGWSPPTFTHRWVLIVLALIIALAATMLVIGSRLPQPRLSELGRNGLVAFDADWQIYTMNGDGTGRRQIASGPLDFWPIWSPDGSTLLFHRSPGIGPGARQVVQYWIARADGSGATNITRGYTIYRSLRWLPSWSPASDAIVFASASVSSSALYIAPVSGQGIRQIVDTTLKPSAPSWSPIGDAIAFKGGQSDADRGIYLVNTDGSGLRKLTANSPPFSDDTVPLWSPDGRRLLFQAGEPGAEDLWLVNADGSDMHKLTDTPGPIDEYWPAWSPDGTQIAFNRSEGLRQSAVYVIDADGTDLERVSPDMSVAQTLVWSPDGKRILTSVCCTSGQVTTSYGSGSKGQPGPDVVLLDPRGVEPPQLLANEPELGEIFGWQRLAPIPTP